MKDFFRLKSWLVLLVMIFLGIVLAVAVVSFDFRKNVAVVNAGGSDNVSGYAWSDAIGWISFNCSNNSSCAEVDYGVRIDPVTGNFSGYAWSENVGWISFNRSDTGNPPAEPYQDPAEIIIAKYNNATREISGWAKILSLNDDGWIKLRKYSSDTGPDYGVSFDLATGYLSGWAWNGSADGSGVGWVSFNCADAGAGGCASYNYKVAAVLNTPPEIINTNAPNWTYEQACALYAKQAFLRWEFSDSDIGSSQSAYQIIIDDDNNPASPLIDTGKISGTASQYSAGQDVLDYDKTYYWWVKVWDNFDVASGLAAGPSFTTYKHEFPDQDFTWTPMSPSKDEQVTFTSSATVYGATTVSNLLWTAPDGAIDDPATSTPIIIFSSSGNYPVTLKTTDSDGYYCNLTKTINVNVVLPGWKEVKPK